MTFTTLQLLCYTPARRSAAQAPNNVQLGARKHCYLRHLNYSARKSTCKWLHRSYFTLLFCWLLLLCYTPVRSSTAQAPHIVRLGARRHCHLLHFSSFVRKSTAQAPHVVQLAAPMVTNGSESSLPRNGISRYEVIRLSASSTSTVLTQAPPIIFVHTIPLIGSLSRHYQRGRLFVQLAAPKFCYFMHFSYFAIPQYTYTVRAPHTI